MLGSPNASLHFKYIISILVAVILGLISVKWADLPNLFNYLNFALAMTSFAVGIIAIIYSIISGSELTRSLTKVETISASLQESLSEVKTTTHAHLVLSQSVISTSSAVAQQRANHPDPDAFSITQTTKIFLDISSWNGLKTLFIMREAYKAKKSVDLAAWAQIDGTVTFDYAWGFIVAAASFGIITQHNEGNTFTVSFFYNKLDEFLDHAIEQRITSAGQNSERFREQIDFARRFVG